MNIIKLKNFYHYSDSSFFRMNFIVTGEFLDTKKKKDFEVKLNLKILDQKLTPEKGGTKYNKV